MTDVINVETVDRLRRLYKHVDDVDLFTGGLSERFCLQFSKMSLFVYNYRRSLHSISEKKFLKIFLTLCKVDLI